jgi:asparagine synthase (glutamine-hydrolysing)
MSHAFLFVPAADASAESPTWRQGVQALQRFKQVQVSDQAITPAAALAIAPAAKGTDQRIARSSDGQVCIAAFGTWLSLPAVPGRDTAWLLDQYLAHGAAGLARQLQGIFVLIIIDSRQQQTHIITDRCGSLHAYWRPCAGGHAVSLSSAVLAMLDEAGAAQLDPVAVHEFIATGILYEDRSLWQGVRKIGPATVFTLGPQGVQARPYWQFADIRPESLPLDQAIDQTHHALVDVLKALPATPQPLVSDLTGGYDSRFLLSGLVKAGRPFTTTVSGAAQHPDVTVAARIAAELGLQHQHIPSQQIPSPEEFDAALRMTDGEYDAFDYARILATHRRLSAAHGMSLNGSFGELARGYWWELLWPRLAQRQPLDVAMVARKRFAAIPYDKALFAPAAQLDLAAHMAAVAGRAIAPIAAFPNTTQMDCVYYSLRMQRWQGRITSATNQLWPAFSPIGFAQVLEPILAAKASTRFRSLFVRATFARFAPALARIPLEHGYPPMPAKLFNLWRFSPLLGHYGGKVWGKLAPRLGIKPAAPASDPEQVRQFNADAVSFLQASGIAAALESPLLLKSGLFQPDALRRYLTDNIQGKFRSEQWRRLVTLEVLTRKLGQ